MKWERLIFSALAATSLFAAGAAVPDSLSSDSVVATVIETVPAPVNPRYEQRMAKRVELWNRLIPNMLTLQYAGDIGTVSAGIGWDYGRSNQWETHLLIGLVTKQNRQKAYVTTTLRETYVPWRIRLSPLWSIRPLSVSLSANTILNGDFWVSEPDRYPSGYYGFSSKIRFHLGLGQRIAFSIPERKRVAAREVSIYYEISTCDLYVRQKIKSSSIPLKDIIVIGLGAIFVI